MRQVQVGDTLIERRTGRVNRETTYTVIAVTPSDKEVHYAVAPGLTEMTVRNGYGATYAGALLLSYYSTRPIQQGELTAGETIYDGYARYQPISILAVTEKTVRVKFQTQEMTFTWDGRGYKRGKTYLFPDGIHGG